MRVLVYLLVIVGFAFVTWALLGLCEVHAGVSRLFGEINQERGWRGKTRE